MEVFKLMFPDEFGGKDLRDVVGFHAEPPEFIKRFAALGNSDEPRLPAERAQQIDEAVEGLLVVDLKEQPIKRPLNLSS